MGSLFAGIWQRASTNRTTAVLSVVTLLIILTAVPLTVFLSKQQQTIEQHAAGDNPQISIAPAACMATPTDTVIIIDKSGSMLGDKITKAKTAAKSFVDILSQNPKNKVSLVTFSTAGTTDVPFTSNFSSVKSRIDTISPNGSTCLECGIKQAITQMQAQSQDGNKKVVVVLTDGIANAIAADMQGSLSMVTKVDPETKVLGITTSRTDLLQQIFNGSGSVVSPTPIYRTPTGTSYPTQYPTYRYPTGFPNISGYPIPSGYPYPTGGSGGNTTQTIAEQQALAAALSAYNTYHSAFYTIGLGGDVNTSFLTDMATKTGGQYNFSPTGDQLTAIYSGISQVIGKGSVTGFVYSDANGNGTYETGENKLSGFQLTLKDANGQTIATTTTSDSGEFTVNAICDGSYVLSATPPANQVGLAWHQTGPTNPDTYTITVTKGSSSGDKDFGFAQGGDTTQAPSPSTTPSPSPRTTLTPTPTGTASANDTKISLTVLLHGIGSAGDNVSSQSSLSNQTPLHPDRNVNVQVFNTSNQAVANTVGTVQYSSASGSFKGTIDLGDALQTGNYNIKVKTDQYLASLLPGIQTIKAGTTNVMPSVSLLAGDVESNNVLNILDYNILIGCYSDFAPAASCTDAQKQEADINDDGQVNQFDYNLFLRELTVHYGQ